MSSSLPLQANNNYMTHTVHPYAHRLGIIRDWKSRWFAKTPADYRMNVMIDATIRRFLKKRQTFRRVLKQTVEKVMANRDVQGVRIGIAGRLGGAEMSRSEEIKRGRIPLQTLRADIDFAREQAYLPYGVIGVKVWIYRGDIFDEKQK